MKTPIKVILEKTNTGYSAYASEIPFLATTGDSFEEIKENFKEIVELQAEYLKEVNQIQEAKNLLESDLQYFLDLEQFFDHFNMINKSAFAQYLGMNESQMRKLSKGIVPLTSKKAQQIQAGLHSLAQDLSAIHFV